MELGFSIPIVSGIPDSLSFIPDSEVQDSGFHKQKITRIQESGFSYMERDMRYGPVIIYRRVGGRRGGGAEDLGLNKVKFSRSPL